jgi:hypothetical protein
MTVLEWFGTWYFWGLFLFVLGLLVWLSWAESKDKEVYPCPTCQSDRQKTRRLIMYNDLGGKHLEPCNDPWHGKYADPY